MWADINGERKKVACGPCIRGHRSSKCDHRDRVLVEVRKPGRPLSSCPHPSGSCSCERVVISYTIPKASECACPSDQNRTAPLAAVTGSRSRVLKSRNRRATNTFTPASIEKAIKATEHVDPDSSSLITRTPTNPSFPPSEDSASNGPSAPSSASSTPFIFPSPPRKHSQASDIHLPEAFIQQPTASSAQEVSSCCRPKLTIEPERQQQPQQTQSRGCYNGKVKEPEKPRLVPVQKSCCSGNNQPPHADAFEQMTPQSAVDQNYAQFSQFQHPGHPPGQPFGTINQPFTPNTGSMGIGLPFHFSTPIYNHMASSYPQSPSMPISPLHHGANIAGNPAPEHNCHCGPSCSCFGCAAHPSNATTTEYIRNMAEFMGTGGFGSRPTINYDIPLYPHHPGYGAEAAYNMSYSGLAQNYPMFGPVQMSLQPDMSMDLGLAHPPVNAVNSWEHPEPQTSIHDPSSTATSYFSPVQDSESMPLQVKTEEAISSPKIQGEDSPEEGKDEDTPTLSPSTYVWQEIELQLPGCNDPTGTCQCGDGCACVGCLTHGGHNGVPLNSPPPPEQDLFSDFVAGSEYGLRGSNAMNGSSSVTPT